MATLSTHTLNSVNGTHAAHVGIALLRIGPAGERTPLSTNGTHRNHNG